MNALLASSRVLAPFATLFDGDLLGEVSQSLPCLPCRGHPRSRARSLQASFHAVTFASTISLSAIMASKASFCARSASAESSALQSISFSPFGFSSQCSGFVYIASAALQLPGTAPRFPREAPRPLPASLRCVLLSLVAASFFFRTPFPPAGVVTKSRYLTSSRWLHSPPVLVSLTIAYRGYSDRAHALDHLKLL